ncbi:MAG: ATP-binding protein [Candidatus Anammoxibacter sp.]
MILPENPDLTITVSSVVINIEDNGNGMPDDVKDKIFNPVFTTKKVGEGSVFTIKIPICQDLVKTDSQ